jgi:hypothetical protein
LSNKSPFYFAGESRKENMFLNGKRHVQNEMDIDGHGPKLMPNNCKNLNPPYFLLPSAFNSMETPIQVDMNQARSK